MSEERTQQKDFNFVDLSMRPVMQTEFEAATGNSLQACVASIFELELRDG
jgi:hypothetical protein